MRFSMLVRAAGVVLLLLVAVSAIEGYQRHTARRAALNRSLRQAISKGDRVQIKALLKRGADYRAADGSGHTILYAAIKGADLELAKDALSHGVEAPTPGGSIDDAMVLATMEMAASGHTQAGEKRSDRLAHITSALMDRIFSR
jgi:hypothetical protein